LNSSHSLFFFTCTEKPELNFFPILYLSVNRILGLVEHSNLVEPIEAKPTWVKWFWTS